jgi:hypothetical protein
LIVVGLVLAPSLVATQAIGDARRVPGTHKPVDFIGCRGGRVAVGSSGTQSRGRRRTIGARPANAARAHDVFVATLPIDFSRFEKITSGTSTPVACSSPVKPGEELASQTL